MEYREKDVMWRCTLPMKKGQFDNEYVFLNNGMIIHEYDLNVNKYNFTEVVDVSDIQTADFEKIRGMAEQENRRDVLEKFVLLSK